LDAVDGIKYSGGDQLAGFIVNFEADCFLTVVAYRNGDVFGMSDVGTEYDVEGVGCWIYTSYR
jgi:hypothetical protein